MAQTGFIIHKGNKALCKLCENPLELKITKDIKKYDRIYNIYFCKKCNVGTTFPLPSTEELEGLYSSGSYRTDAGKRFNLVIEYLIYLFRISRKKRIKRYFKIGNILDIGCGRGLFLEVMRRDGWNVKGVEFNEEIAQFASKCHDIEIIPISSIKELSDNSFDVVTINHTLEHAERAQELLSECRRILRRKGLLVIAVPNLHSLQALVGQDVWFHLDLPFHVNHYTEDGISKLLSKHSFKVVEIRHFDLEYNPFGWLQTLLNLTGLSENLLYNAMKHPNLRQRNSDTSRFEVILSLFLLPFYLPISFILSILESFLLKRGGTIEVYAIKM